MPTPKIEKFIIKLAKQHRVAQKFPESPWLYDFWYCLKPDSTKICVFFAYNMQTKEAYDAKLSLEIPQACSNLTEAVVGNDMFCIFQTISNGSTFLEGFCTLFYVAKGGQLTIKNKVTEKLWLMKRFIK